MNKKLILKNIFLLILSLAVGIIHIYPDLKFIHELGNGFKGITFNATHDSSIYLGRINNIYKGYSKTMPSIDLYEHRNDPWTVPFGELLLGAIGSGLHIPLNYFKIICSFFLPIINFWLVFVLFSYWLGRKPRPFFPPWQLPWDTHFLPTAHFIFMT